MTSWAFEVAVECHSLLGEGPCWDGRAGVLYWVDIVAGRVHRYEPDSGRDSSAQVGAPVGFVVPRASGGLVVGLGTGLAVLDGDAFDISSHARPAVAAQALMALETPAGTTRTNDGCCDAAGRLWVGTMALDERSPLGGLFRVDADLAAECVITGTTISNGHDWSPSRDRFYFVDSPTRRINVFDHDPATGTIENRRALATLDPGEIGADAVPDGLRVDADGCLWVALHGGWGLRRYSPDGELLARVELPVARVTCCCFGGEGLRDLYVTTRRDGLSDPELEAQPLAGSLLRLDPGVAGLPSHPFAG